MLWWNINSSVGLVNGSTGIVIDWISQPYLDDVGKRYHAGAMITLQNAPYYKLDRSYQPDPV